MWLNENPILIDNEENKENSPATTLVSERLIELSKLLRSQGKDPDSVYGRLFERKSLSMLCMWFQENCQRKGSNLSVVLTISQNFVRQHQFWFLFL